MSWPFLIVQMLVTALAIYTASEGVASAANYQFCLRYPTARHYDASPNSDSEEFGEDYGRNGGTWKMRGMSASVVAVTGGVLEWSGYLDGNGCTSSFAATSDNFNIYYSPYYSSSDTGVTIRVYDCPVGINCVFNLFSQLNYDPNDAGGVSYPLLSTAYVMDIYVSAAFAVERFLGDYYAGPPSHHFRFQSTGQDSQGGFTSTTWDSTTDEAVIRLNTISARAKFETVHEFGHGIMLDRIGGVYTLNCAYGSGDSNNHSMTSLEYQSCAATEGFGHFVAAATWNDFDAVGAGGVYVDIADQDTMTAYDVEIGSKKILDHCNPCYGYGVELDWVRFLWDYRTDSGTRPLIDDIMDAIPVADPWGASSGFYATWFHAIESVAGATQRDRFNDKAVANGTNW